MTYFIKVMIAFLTLLLSPDAVRSQVHFYVNYSKSCSFDCPSEPLIRIPIRPYAYTYSEKATKTVATILDKIGLKTNFNLESSQDLSGVALSTEMNGDRIIVYNEKVMEAVDLKKNTNWYFFAVFAHEIGHHLLKHKFDSTRKGKPQDELKADTFAGFTLNRLGASRLDVEKAYSELSEVQCDSHPDKSVRIKAALGGWDDAYSQINTAYKNTSEISRPSTPTKVNREEKANLGRVVFWTRSRKSTFIVRMNSHNYTLNTHFKKSEVPSESSPEALNIDVPFGQYDYTIYYNGFMKNGTINISQRCTYVSVMKTDFPKPAPPPSQTIVVTRGYSTQQYPVSQPQSQPVYRQPTYNQPVYNTPVNNQPVNQPIRINGGVQIQGGVRIR